MSLISADTKSVAPIETTEVEKSIKTEIESKIIPLYLPSKDLGLALENGQLKQKGEYLKQVGADEGTHRKVYFLQDGRVIKLQECDLFIKKPFSHPVSDNGTELALRQVFSPTLQEDLPSIEGWGVLEEGETKVDYVVEKALSPLSGVTLDKKILKAMERPDTQYKLEDLRDLFLSDNSQQKIADGIRELLERGWGEKILDFGISNLGLDFNGRVVLMDAGTLKTPIPEMFKKMMSDLTEERYQKDRPVTDPIKIIPEKKLTPREKMDEEMEKFLEKVRQDKIEMKRKAGEEIQQAIEKAKQEEKDKRALGVQIDRALRSGERTPESLTPDEKEAHELLTDYLERAKRARDKKFEKPPTAEEIAKGSDSVSKEVLDLLKQKEEGTK